MNNNLSQNGKVLEKKLEDCTSDVKTILRGLRNFKMALPFLQVLEKPPDILVSLCHMH